MPKVKNKNNSVKVRAGKKTKARVRRAELKDNSDSYLDEESRVEVVRTGSLSKNFYVRDIQPASTAKESFTIHQLTPDDMPQVESLS